ncbi:MAG: sigma-70 family RNA polymerase sigma factor [Pirellulaceae bacterium]|nr:sigma-70 family RNA polymerase sigma factor [Pirellulaceae bacterium]
MRPDISPSASSSSLSLLDRVQANDPQAWPQFVQLYGPLVAHWCRGQGLQANDIADVTQTVFLAVFRGLAKFRQESTPLVASLEKQTNKGPDLRHSPTRSSRLRSWIWKITRRKILDWARSQRPDTARGGSSVMSILAELPAPTLFENDSSDGQGSNATSLGEGVAWRAVIRRAMAQIRPDFRPETWDAFWRSVIEGQTTAFVSDQTGLSHAAIRQARSRVTRRLRQQMGEL